MNKLNKKAVSAVVATVLIIMITVAAVGLLWSPVINMVKGISQSTVCNDALSDVSLVVNNGFTCYNSSDKILSIQVSKGPNANIDLVGLDVMIFSGGNSNSIRVNATGNSGDVSGFLPDNNEFKTITIKDVASADKVSIVPIVSVGKTEKVCAATSEVVLGPCK